jgi:hypothetical protein
MDTPSDSTRYLADVPHLPPAIARKMNRLHLSDEEDRQVAAAMDQITDRIREARRRYEETTGETIIPEMPTYYCHASARALTPRNP